MYKTPERMHVLIPTHGRPVLLERTLASLGACHLPESYRETVVVENGSQAGAEAVVADIAATHPALRLRYLHVERANKSHALNEALATVGEGLVVFLDDDVRVAPQLLEAYAKAARERTEGTYFGGSVAVDYEEAPPEWVVPALPFSARGYRFDQGDRPEPGLFLGFNWAAFASDLKSVGNFDPEYGPGSATGATGQEYNMQRRLQANGVTAEEVPGALVWHYVPRHRCSPAWALRRKYKVGIEDGLQTRAAANRPRFLRVSGHAVQSALAYVKRALLRDAAGRFSARASLWRDAGFIVGYLSRP